MKRHLIRSTALRKGLLGLAVVLTAALGNSLHAQQKVNDGTVPATAINPGAIAEYQTNNKALLMPRIALTSDTDKVTIPNPVMGMMCIGLIDTGAISKGQLYWFDGFKWIAPLTQNRVGSIPPIPTNWIWSSATIDPIVSNNVYVNGPFTVPSTGWYSFINQIFFTHTVPSGANSDYNPLTTVTICENDTTSLIGSGQIWQTRFVTSAQATTPPTPGFLFLQAGSSYYVKHVSDIPPGYGLFVSAQRQMIVAPFK
jgi:hypothetical protein